VDDEDWQKFRLSLKGTSTRHKLVQLKAYLAIGVDSYETRKIRVDNYLKALARGGQIEAPALGTYIEDLNADCLAVKRE
jgi:hypothetical protein